MVYSRRGFLSSAALLALRGDLPVETVRGPVDPGKLQTTLIHEHLLVDFVGADKVSPSRYDRQAVIDAARPKLDDLKLRGCRTFVDCTPAWLGRDVSLLAELSRLTGLHILTNTGLYGASNDKFLPKSAFEQTPEQLAALWIKESKDGIDGTRIRPAFMKLGVDPQPLSEIDRKLIRAGALCHKETGLRIHVHTGPAVAAMDILEELRRGGVSPSAYVWVHAQSEKDRKAHLEAARAGAWVEFDGISEKTIDENLSAVTDMAAAGLLGQVLLSQDSGWYNVGEPGGGAFRGYTFLFDGFLPALRVQAKFTEQQIDTLMVRNPARALTRAARNGNKSRASSV